jgi:hypothetical protein
VKRDLALLPALGCASLPNRLSAPRFQQPLSYDLCLGLFRGHLFREGHATDVSIAARNMTMDWTKSSRGLRLAVDEWSSGEPRFEGTITDLPLSPQPSTAFAGHASAA